MAAPQALLFTEMVLALQDQADGSTGATLEQFEVALKIQENILGYR